MFITVGIKLYHYKIVPPTGNKVVILSQTHSVFQSQIITVNAPQASLCGDGFFELDPLNFDVVVDELVDVSDDSAALDVHKYERGHDLVVQGRVSAGD